MRIFWFICICPIFFYLDRGFSQSAAQVEDSDMRVDLSGHIGLYSEPRAIGQEQLAIGEANRKDFKIQTSSLLNFDYSPDVYWLKFTLANSSEQAREFIIEIATSWLDQVSLFEAESNAWNERKTGDTLSSERAKEYRYPTFALHLEPYILIGDVTGHGIPSALITGAVAGAAETAINLIAREHLSPLESLHKIVYIVRELGNLVHSVMGLENPIDDCTFLALKICTV